MQHVNNSRNWGVGEIGAMYENSVLSAQFFCKPETAGKKYIYLFLMFKDFFLFWRERGRERARKCA